MAHPTDPKPPQIKPADLPPGGVVDLGGLVKPKVDIGDIKFTINLQDEQRNPMGSREVSSNEMLQDISGWADLMAARFMISAGIEVQAAHAAFADSLRMFIQARVEFNALASVLMGAGIINPQIYHQQIVINGLFIENAMKNMFPGLEPAEGGFKITNDVGYRTIASWSMDEIITATGDGVEAKPDQEAPTLLHPANG